MYQITNHDPAPPSSLNPQVPVMLDYIIAKVLTKSPDARYQSAADLANDLRECRAQMETGVQSVGAHLTPTRPIPVAPQAAATPTPQGDQELSDEAVSSPTKGISRAFDSLEATQRLMRQIGADGTTEFVATKAFSATTISRARAFRSEVHPWGRRENVVFGVTVSVALVIAVLIYLL
jgi:serine/threonine-protein kinase